MFSVLLPAQKMEIIKLDKNFKDKNSRTKSLNLIDSRADKDLGTLLYK